MHEWGVPLPDMRDLVLIMNKLSQGLKQSPHDQTVHCETDGDVCMTICLTVEHTNPLHLDTVADKSVERLHRGVIDRLTKMHYGSIYRVTSLHS